ncbi:hypothetical protein FB451DRAFT_1511103, partial [Mycena latifolia]
GRTLPRGDGTCTCLSWPRILFSSRPFNLSECKSRNVEGRSRLRQRPRKFLSDVCELRAESASVRRHPRPQSVFLALPRPLPRVFLPHPPIPLFFFAYAGSLRVSSSRTLGGLCVRVRLCPRPVSLRHGLPRRLSPLRCEAPSAGTAEPPAHTQRLPTLSTSAQSAASARSAALPPPSSAHPTRSHHLPCTRSRDGVPNLVWCLLDLSWSSALQFKAT